MKVAYVLTVTCKNTVHREAPPSTMALGVFMSPPDKAQIDLEIHSWEQNRKSIDKRYYEFHSSNVMAMPVLD